MPSRTNLVMCKCANVRMWGFDDVQIWRFISVFRTALQIERPEVVMWLTADGIRGFGNIEVSQHRSGLNRKKCNYWLDAVTADFPFCSMIDHLLTINWLTSRPQDPSTLRLSTAPTLIRLDIRLFDSIFWLTIKIKWQNTSTLTLISKYCITKLFRNR